MSILKKYQPTEKAQAFLDKVENAKYDRGIITGLKKYIDKKVPEDMHQTLFLKQKICLKINQQIK